MLRRTVQRIVHTVSCLAASRSIHTGHEFAFAFDLGHFVHSVQDEYQFIAIASMNRASCVLCEPGEKKRIHFREKIASPRKLPSVLFRPSMGHFSQSLEPGVFMPSAL